jgi:hypothetical protein
MKYWQHWSFNSVKITHNPSSCSPLVTIISKNDSPLDQNKQLCKAAKLRHGGTKKELIERLMDDDQTSQFGIEGKYIGLNVEAIKQMCRQRNLQVSGQRFDLVLRILHNDNDSTPEGKTLKRAATETVTTLDTKTGEVVEKQVPGRRRPHLPAESTREYKRRLRQ